ncbi:MAG: C4-type zinc ribbon domain-containing protein [Actinobacteria bacterium]|nr:C4-type zinc ribbon domain-containing protein [Actinomycetota bacterium]
MKSSPEEQERVMTLQTLDTLLTQLAHKEKTLSVIQALEILTISHNSTRDLIIAAETEKADIKHELSKSEIDVEQVVTRIEKDEKRMASGTASPKELEQMQHELASLNKRRSELEEIELEVMVRVDGIDDRIKSLSVERDQFKLKMAELDAQKTKELTDIAEAVSSANGKRADIAAKISAEVVELYEKIKKTGDGIGAARLIEGKCDGCHLSINAVELSKIKETATDEIVRCEECRRILVRPKGF